MNISEKILKLRKEKGLSQEAFAEKLGVSRQSVSKWESSGALPDIDKIIAMSELFGVSTDYLLKDEMTESAVTEEAFEEVTVADEEITDDEPVAPDEEFTEAAPEPKPVKKKRKIGRKIIAIILVILITAAAIGLPTYFGGVKELWWALNGGKIDYSYVLVHGLGGWGEGDGINDVAQYWGGGKFDLKAALEENGYTVHTPSIGPVSSTWDRACELYAQLTGTTVDYGKAHSEAHNHARFGRKYTTPLVENWGEKVNGGQTVKINLVGHSFGGATVRLLASLLEYGNKFEIGRTGDDTSPLFTGGKGHYIHSVTTLCAPHNGSTLTEVLNSVSSPFADTTDMLMALCFGVSGISSPVEEIYDIKLDQFEIDKSDTRSALKSLVAAGNDHAAYDLSPDGAAELNEQIKTVDGVYYFSYSYSTTAEGKLLGNHLPEADTFPVLLPFAAAIGSYSGTTDGGIVIDSSWKENDGLVNVVSAQYPFGDEHSEFPEKEKDIKPGIWYVAETRNGDHGTVIGLNAKKAPTVEFYTELFNMIEELR